MLPRLAEVQSAFRTAMEEGGDENITKLLARPSTGPDIATRLNVYRNNIAYAAVRALEALYPSLCHLMGQAFFEQIAADFARTYPPPHGRLVEYGFEFPDFVSSYEAAAGYAWFADVARLEVAWHRAYAAAEAPSLEIGELGAVRSDRMSTIELAVHPSCQWLESRFPVSKIWRLGRDETEPDAPIEVEGGPEWLMVIRPDAEVEVRTLSEAGYHFGFALSRGLTLGGAWEAACKLDPNFDLQGHLAGFFAGGTFTDYRLAPDTSNSDDGDPS